MARSDNRDDKNQERSSQKTAHRKLAKSEEIFRLLVDAVEDYAIFALDPNGNIMTWNEGGIRLKGYSPAEAIGSHFSRFYTPEDIARRHPDSELRQAIEKGKYEEEGWRIRKDGSRFWANVVITALRDENGALRGFGKVTRDLTEKRNAEIALRESEERFRLIVESVEDYAVFMLTPAGYIATWNKGAERNKGYSAKEIIGQHFSKFYPESDIRSGKPAFELKEAERLGKFEDEGWRLRKDGTRFWANVIITAMRDRDNRLVGFSKVTRNLTERKKAEDDLRKAYGELEEKVARRTRELSEAKLKAEAAVKARDEFFSIASHELKTPLSAMRLQTQIRKRSVLRGNFSDFAPENLVALCEEDERQVDRLTFLVENMLDISKLTSGGFGLQLETFDLCELARDVVHRMTPMMSEAENVCTLKCEETLRVTWDRHRIEQVLTNFLSNAAKYAPGTAVQVLLLRMDDRVIIQVRDGGKGILEADQQRIFMPFERIEGNSNVGGLGLGLHITKQIVVAHGGDVRVESGEGQGAAFIVTLPINASDKAEENN